MQSGFDYWLHVFVSSFSENGVETADTAYTLALAYANVQDTDAESMSAYCYYSSTVITSVLMAILGVNLGLLVFPSVLFLQLFQ